MILNYNFFFLFYKKEKRMDTKKWASLAVLVFVVGLYFLTIAHRSSEEETGFWHFMGLAFVVAGILVSMGLAISDRPTNLNASDYLQITAIVCSLILLAMSAFREWGFAASSLIIAIPIAITASFNKF